MIRTAHAARSALDKGIAVFLSIASAAVGAADSVHITEMDVKVSREGGFIFSTYCTAKLANAAATRRLAMAGAARAIVQSRVGVVVSGKESMQHGKFDARIQEDTLGVVGALEVVSDDPTGGIAHNLWCVKVKELPAQ